MLIGHKIHTDRFRYEKSTRTFRAEASDLQGLRYLGWVWDDSCDAGFVMVSEKTGTAVPFVLFHTETNEGDILYWDFISYRPGLDEVRARIFARIFND